MDFAFFCIIFANTFFHDMGKGNINRGRRGGMQVATLCISTTMVLVLIGIMVFFTCIARSLSDSVKENLHVTLVLADSVSENQGHLLTKKLYHKNYTHFIDYISNKEILERESKELGINPVEFLESNPFSNTIELTLEAKYANEDSLKWIEKEWKSQKSIAEIRYQKDLMETINTNINKIGVVLLVLLILFLIISVSLINNTIRLGVYSQRFKMHTMKLVGASYGFIRKPFMWKMAFVGLLSAVFASLILSGFLYALYSCNPEMQSIITWDIMLIVVATVFITGLLISVACGFISVNRFLRMKAGDLYRI